MSGEPRVTACGPEHDDTTLRWSLAETHCCLDGKPFATQADYDSIPDGQGEHLCWSAFDQSVNCPDPLAVALALRGENERLRAALAATADTDPPPERPTLDDWDERGRPRPLTADGRIPSEGDR